jgi:hypothetical protein
MGEFREMPSPNPVLIRAPQSSAGTDHHSVALQIAEDMGLMSGPKTKHFNAKVSPRLFDAAARRIGSDSPAVVINAALAALATEDELGPWLARNWGILANTPPEIMEQIDL